MIMAALTALPLLSRVEQGVTRIVGQGLDDLFGAGAAGQNVPASAGSAPANSTQSAAPGPGVGLSSAIMHALVALQQDSRSAASFAEGQSSLSKAQFETVVDKLTGSSSTATTQAADQAFAAADTNGDGSLSATELTAYLSHMSQAAAGRYQTAQDMVSQTLGQLGAVLTGQAAQSA